MSKSYSYDPNWIALRVSYGFNGVVVQAADTPSLRDHLVAGVTRRPPDHLLFECGIPSLIPVSDPHP